ncbi:MAG: hypothetical protein HY043_02555 [Verrucomicrobia bacterium]|nr:hypothetical protein [Verrucomicrobiota bacterium]
MKLHFTSRQRREQGMAVLVVIVLLSIMAVFVLSNGRALGQLKQELKLVEKRQQRRLEPKPAARAVAGSETNGVAGANNPSAK